MKSFFFTAISLFCLGRKRTQDIMLLSIIGIVLVQATGTVSLIRCRVLVFVVMIIFYYYAE